MEFLGVCYLWIPKTGITHHVMVCSVTEKNIESLHLRGVLGRLVKMRSRVQLLLKLLASD